MYLKDSKTVVIKIGSSLLINDNKIIREKWLLEFAKDIKELQKLKKNIVIVSSGAIALGCKKLQLNKKTLKLDKSQAVASIGQIELMNLFKKTFNSNKINISQILITLEDTEQRRRAINAKRTFENLFELNFVPVVNENDSIATSEIKYGDNDRLASRVAQISGADCLILLSDVDGLYSKNPKIHKNAKLIKEIKNIDELINIPTGNLLTKNLIALSDSPPPPGYYIHEVGGAPMGTNDENSVVDQFNRLWRCKNVLVLDGACWPTSSWQSPTLTMMALSRRACLNIKKT